MKEQIIDILYMIWSFIAGGICFILITNHGNGFLIGKIVYLEEAGEMLSKSFAILGMGFIILLPLILLLKEFCVKWNKNKK